MDKKYYMLKQLIQCGIAGNSKLEKINRISDIPIEKIIKNNLYGVFPFLEEFLWTACSACSFFIFSGTI